MGMRRISRAPLSLVVCAALAGALSACSKEPEGANPLDTKPGVYKGVPVTQLSPETLAELEKRAKFQEFYNRGGPK